jgi:hypothetical protein
MSGLNTHGCPCDGLLARTTKAVNGDARSSDWPAGGQHGHTTDTRAVITDAVAIANDDVINIRRVEADAFLQGVQHLSEQLLWMNVV